LTVFSILDFHARQLSAQIVAHFASVKGAGLQTVPRIEPPDTGLGNFGHHRYATGLPVRFQSFGDNALVQVQNNGFHSVRIDLPNYNPSLGSLNVNRDPSRNPLVFNTNVFRPTRSVRSAILRAVSSMGRGKTITTELCARSPESRNPAHWNSVSKPSTPSTLLSSMARVLSTATSAIPPSGKS
jgi:hypothetical protein